MATSMSAGTTCILYGNRPLISETFLAAHVERLRPGKVVLHNYFPEYTCNGRTLRCFYSKSPLLRKAQRLLPQFLHDRWVTRFENSVPRILDFMAGFFEDHAVDVILAEYGFNGADIAPIAATLGIPLVVHFHGHDAHRSSEVVPYHDKYRVMFDVAHRVLSVSEPMTRRLIDLGADPARIVYNPYGARESFFEVEPDYGNTLIAIGRFADIKAPYLTLMAFRHVLEELPESQLVMVGDGPLLECCRKLARVWGLRHQVTFAGALPQEEFLPLMSKACGFVQHSVTTTEGDSEGMPNSILEAGAAGLPVIATRHAGIPEAVVDGKTGFLVDELDVQGMATHMKTILSDKSLCREMGARSRDHVRAKFRLNQHIDRLQEVIDSARGSSPRVIANG